MKYCLPWAAAPRVPPRSPGGHRGSATISPVPPGVARISEPTRLALLSVGALAVAMVILLVSGSLKVHQLVTPGGRGPSAEVIAEDFGAWANDPEATGYDGQQTYAIARYFPDLDAAADHTDSPRYRMLRILPAAVVSPLPNGAPTVLGLLALNLAGLGLAVRAGARILDGHGAAARFGVVAASPLLVGVLAATAEPIAMGLALTAIELLLRERHRDAMILFVLASLSRETMALVAVAAGAGLVVRQPGAAIRTTALYALPAVAIGGWYLVLGGLVGGDLPRRSELLGFLDIDPVDMAVAAVVAILGGLAVWTWRDLPPLALPCLGFTAWMAIYTADILQPLALVRVNAFPIVVGLLAVGRHLDRQHPSGGRSGSMISPARIHRHPI